MKEQITWTDLDNLADIIWWIKGYMAGARDNCEYCPFGQEHVESLRKVRVNLQDEIEEKK